MCSNVLSWQQNLNKIVFCLQYNMQIYYNYANKAKEAKIVHLHVYGKWVFFLKLWQDIKDLKLLWNKMTAFLRNNGPLNFFPQLFFLTTLCLNETFNNIYERCIEIAKLVFDITKFIRQRLEINFFFVPSLSCLSRWAW
jgi:hypothetical protein